MSKLTREEVLHVANLARLDLTEDEIEKYSYQLKEIYDSIDKINDIETETNEILIAPTENVCDLREDSPKEELKTKDIINNAPNKFDSYIEVRGVFND